MIDASIGLIYVPLNSLTFVSFLVLGSMIVNQFEIPGGKIVRGSFFVEFVVWFVSDVEFVIFKFSTTIGVNDADDEISALFRTRPFKPF